MVSHCSSCKVNVANLSGTTVFPCPKCGEQTLIRCPQCRKTGARYACAGCGFEGPN